MAGARRAGSVAAVGAFGARGVTWRCGVFAKPATRSPEHFVQGFGQVCRGCGHVGASHSSIHELLEGLGHPFSPRVRLKEQALLPSCSASQSPLQQHFRGGARRVCAGRSGAAACARFSGFAADQCRHRLRGGRGGNFERSGADGVHTPCRSANRLPRKKPGCSFAGTTVP